MQRALVIAVAVLLVAFVQAQPPPSTIYTCTNSTPLATTNFCSSVVNYPIQQSVNINTVDTNAYTLYNTTFATINSSLANCPSSLKTYICQNAFQKCSGAQLSAGVLQSVCDAVSTGCGVTSFPTNFTELTNCIANSARSVSGTTTVCAASTVATGIGQTCRPYTAIIDNAYTGAQSTIGCPTVSGCNNTLCTRQSNLGDACLSNSGCVNGNGLLGSSLTCINGQCQYTGKRNGYNCSDNAECLSNICDPSTKKCLEQAIDQNCTLSTQCQRNLYCETSTGKCAAVALADVACGQVLSSSYVPCTAGFTCVNTTSGAVKGVCKPNAGIGSPCSNQTAVLTYNAPLCSLATIPLNGTAVCYNSVCTLNLGNQGDVCDTLRQCRPDLTCQYGAGQTTGLCQTAASVSCATDGSAQFCNSLQTCSCTSAGSNGVCAVTTSGAYQCIAQQIAVAQCLINNCGGVSDAFYPYDGYSCASTNCAAVQNDYYCCISKFSPNFIAPNNAPSVLCTTTVAPTTTPAASTTGTPGTTVTPTTTKASGAFQNVVSLAVLLVAFVAFSL